MLDANENANITAKISSNCNNNNSDKQSLVRAPNFDINY